MDGEDDFDTHLCLSCHTAIIGLDSYVHHKKNSCPARRVGGGTKATLPVPSSTNYGLSTPSTLTAMASGILTLQSQGRSLLASPPPVPTSFTSNLLLSPSAISHEALYPNQAIPFSTATSTTCTNVSSTSTNILDFLSSLDLQLRSPHGQRDTTISYKAPIQSEASKVNLSYDAIEQHAKSLFDSSKLNLPVLQDLNFSSDSEGFDAPNPDELLDFSDEDLANEPATSVVGSHTTWPLGGKGSASKWHSLNQPHRHPHISPGKHHGHHSSGKGASSSGKMISQQQNTVQNAHYHHGYHTRGKPSGQAAYSGQWLESPPPIADTTQSAQDTAGDRAFSAMLESLGLIQKMPASQLETEPQPQVSGASAQSVPAVGKFKETLIPQQSGKLKAAIVGTNPPETDATSDKLDTSLGSPPHVEARNRPNIGGKWRPRQYHHHGGKWKPGQRPQASHGKSILNEEQSDSDEDGDDEEEQDDSETEDMVGETFSGSKITQGGTISGCDLGDVEQWGSLSVPCVGAEVCVEGQTQRHGLGSGEEKQLQDLQHVTSKHKTGHTKKGAGKGKCKATQKDITQDNVLPEDDHGYIEKIRPTDPNENNKEFNKDQGTIKTDSAKLECPLCERTYSNKNSFLKHLTSAGHLKKANGEDPFLLDEGCQMLLLTQCPFQCKVCEFYVCDVKLFMAHVRSAEHVTACQKMVGHLQCTGCKHKAQTQAEMLEHLSSLGHKKLIATTKKCILKESRSNIQCNGCHKAFHSATHLARHQRRRCRAQQQSQDIEMVASSGPSSSFRCTFCEKLFTSKYSTQIHIRRAHTKEKPYRCELCTAAYADQGSLNLHLKSKAHLERLVTLAVEKKTNKSGVASPQKIVTPKTKQYKCDHCDFSTTLYSSLRPHYLESHAKQTFHCDVCGINFVSQNLYNKHCRTACHLANVTKHQVSPDATHSCRVCGRLFYDIKLLQLHELTKHSIQSTDKSKSSPQELANQAVHEEFDSFLKTLPKDKTAMVECPVCHKVVTRGHILNHLRMHVGKLPFICRFCDKGFFSPEALRNHLKIHLGVQVHACPMCPRKFVKLASLQEHQLRKHNGMMLSATPKWSCPVCGERFLHRYRVEIHLKRVHRCNMLPCPTEECRQVFCYKSELTTHMRTHTKEKPYLCEQCAYTARTRSQLTRHRITHTGQRPHQCQYCPYRSQSASSLQRHKRIHTGAKPYSCPHCSHRCSNFSYLRRHILAIHPDLPIYKCPECSFGTMQATQFSEHLLQVHELSEHSVGRLSSYAGIYHDDSDMREVAEGSQVLPVQEKRPKKAPPQADRLGLVNLCPNKY